MTDDLYPDDLRPDEGAQHQPKSIEYAHAIPVSPLGKTDKKALRAQYWGDTGRKVH